MKAIAGVLLCFAMIAAARGEQRQDEVGSAIDAKGIRYVARRPTGMPSWIADAVFRPKPDYPRNERASHNEGSGLFRVSIDVKTGLVTSVTTVQSTGFPKLDEAAINALQRWRWKPGTWKQVETPVTFTMSGSAWHH